MPDLCFSPILKNEWTQTLQNKGQTRLMPEERIQINSHVESQLTWFDSYFCFFGWLSLCGLGIVVKLLCILCKAMSPSLNCKEASRWSRNYWELLAREWGFEGGGVWAFVNVYIICTIYIYTKAKSNCLFPPCFLCQKQLPSLRNVRVWLAWSGTARQPSRAPPFLSRPLTYQRCGYTGLMGCDGDLPSGKQT